MLAKSTLLLVAALGTLGPVAMPQVNALSHTGAPPARRAEHLNMANKMIKKRGVAPRQNLAPVKRQDEEEEVVPLIPSPSSQSAVTSSTTSAVSSTTTTSSSTTSSISTSTSSTTSTQSSSSTAPPSSSTNTNTSTRTRPSVTPSASEPVEETEEPESSTPSRTRSLGTSTAIVFETTRPSTDSQDKSKDQEASSIPKPVLIGLVVAAACIATAAALWTVIRKWKFGASRQFEDRLEPVNWEPTNAPPAEAHDPTALAVHRANSVNSHSARSSEEQRVGYGTYGNMNMSSTNNNPVTLAPELPPHDFTAGGAGGYGGYGGYADMQRGPSPAPPSLQRGPSSSQGHGGRDEYGMPNPYDAYDYNSGYNNGYNNGRYNNGPGPHQF